MKNVLTWIPRRLRATDGYTKVLFVITLVAFAVRGALAFIARNVVAFDDERSDPGSLMSLGNSWWHGNFNRVQNGTGGINWGIPPVYPAFLGLVLRVREFFGSHGSVRLWVGLAQAVFAALLVFGIGWVARRIADNRHNPRIALTAAFIMALWFGNIFFSATIMSEGLYTPYLFAALGILVWPRVASHWRLFLVGFLLGFGCLIRTASLWVAITAVVVVFCETVCKDWQLAAKRGVMVLFGIGVVLGPWVVFTYSQTGHPFISSFEGRDLCEGAMPKSDGGAHSELCPLPESTTMNAGDVNVMMRSRAWHGLLDNPGHWVGLVPARWNRAMEFDVDFAYVYPGENIPNQKHQLPLSEGWTITLASVWWFWMNILAMSGFLRVFYIRIKQGYWLEPRILKLVLLGSSIMLGPLMSVGLTRYHMPLYPYMAILAAIGLQGLWHVPSIVCNRYSS